MSRSGYDYLESLLMFGIKPGLESTRKLCQILGNPEKSFRTIHIVGTNGKGSTSFYLANILQAHGKKTVLYTSPHLISLRERIRFNGCAISDTDFNSALLAVQKAAKKANLQATYFEALTVAAFLYAKNNGAEFFVAEAGLGGRLDATAVAEGTLTVLTGIGLEHTAILGDSEEKILAEKIGIVKPNSKLIYADFSNSLTAKIKKLAHERPFQIIDLYRGTMPQLPNIGKHYQENARLSFAAAREILGNSWNLHLAEKGLQTSFWPGRMQFLQNADGKLRFILDGAHNPHATKRLAETLQERFPGKKFRTVFGALQDKDLSEMLEYLSPSVSVWHLSKTPYERFREPDSVAQEILSIGGKVGLSEIMSREFLQSIEAVAENDPILITGSLYLIGSAIYALRNEFDALAFFRDMRPEANEKH